MKKVLILFMSALLSFTVVGCSSGASTANNKSNSSKMNYKDGTYTAVGQGKSGAVKVEVKVASGKINEIDVLDNKETPAMMGTVKENLIPEIIKKQGVEGVDALSGATLASNAVLDAVGKVEKEAAK
jgi:uncharacterized protein with FMN-binding domain